MALTRLSNQSLTSVTALPAAISTGKVLQCVNNNYTTSATSNSQNTYVTSSTCDITITNASSKILLLANFNIDGNGCNALYRINKVISGTTTTLYTSPSWFFRNNGSDLIDQMPFINFLHTHGSSVGTTITYQTQVTWNQGANTISLNNSATSHETLMEIL